MEGHRPIETPRQVHHRLCVLPIHLGHCVLASSRHTHVYSVPEQVRPSRQEAPGGRQGESVSSKLWRPREQRARACSMYVSVSDRPPSMQQPFLRVARAPLCGDMLILRLSIIDLHQKFRDQQREFSPDPARPFYGYVTTAIVRRLCTDTLTSSLACCPIDRDGSLICKCYGFSRTRQRQRRRYPPVSLSALHDLDTENQSLDLSVVHAQSATASCDTTSIGRTSCEDVFAVLEWLWRRGGFGSWYDSSSAPSDDSIYRGILLCMYRMCGVVVSHVEVMKGCYFTVFSFSNGVPGGSGSK